ncbi:uncharacterized protein AB675_6294 [Cyphellophora attinorum]|uniref:GPI anchored serine-threonine rich protein n=1 Tax=Cyphellophora attinorum TaxID=1664694 RepID=A0A0N1H9F5_9EURO|nr:uncharacterized protein AB675_6294 [Phialophora attinorum]KPI44097.1 hypothetical protein AB675_6294 [Phialophora attinorum]
MGREAHSGPYLAKSKQKKRKSTSKSDTETSTEAESEDTGEDAAVADTSETKDTAIVIDVRKGTTSHNCILDACKGTIQGQINSCATNDWGCLCTQYINLLTCYNNCPGDTGVASVQQQREQYCNFASVYSSSTTRISAASTTASSSATSSSDETAQTGFASASGSQTAASTSSDNAAAAATQIVANIAFAAGAAAYMFL